MIWVVVVAVTTVLAPAMSMEPHLVNLPPHLFSVIAGSLTETQSLANLDQTCHYTHDILQNCLFSLQTLLNPSIDVKELPDRIRAYTRLTAEDTHLHAELTHQDAAFLYDRVIFSSLSAREKVAILTQLLDLNRNLFRRFIHLCNIPLEDAAEYLEVLDPVQDVYGVPDCILSLIPEITSQMNLYPNPQDQQNCHLMDEIRSRYPAPFNTVFPNNYAVGHQLLKRLKKDPNLECLQQYEVVLALLRYGIRLGATMFPPMANLQQIPLIYPLLWHTPPSSYFIRLMNCDDIAQIRMLLQIPGLITQIRQSSRIFAHHFHAALIENRTVVIHTLIQQPFFIDILDAKTSVGQSLMGVIFKHGDPKFISFFLSYVLQHPKFLERLRNDPWWFFSQLEPLFDRQLTDCTKLIVTDPVVADLFTPKLIHSLPDPPSALLTLLFLSDYSDQLLSVICSNPTLLMDKLGTRLPMQPYYAKLLIKSIIKLPIVSEIINMTSAGMPLLHHACSKLDSTTVLTLLQVPGIDFYCLDSDRRTALSRLFLRMPNDPVWTIFCEPDFASALLSNPLQFVSDIETLFRKKNAQRLRDIAAQPFMKDFMKAPTYEAAATQLLHYCKIYDLPEIKDILISLSNPSRCAIAQCISRSNPNN